MRVFVCCRLALRRSAFLLGGSVYWLALGSLRAQSGDASVDVQLSYDAPRGCGSREQVLARVEQAVSGLPTAVRVSATVTVRESVAGLNVHYRAFRDGATNERQLVVADCSAAVEASALLLSLTLDPVFGQPGASDASEVAEPPLAESVPPTATTTNPVPATPRAPKPKEVAPADELSRDGASAAAPTTRAPGLGRVYGSVGGQIVSGVAPRAAVGVYGSVGASALGLTARVNASHLWAAAGSVPSVPESNVVSRLSRLHLLVGYPLSSGHVRLTPALGLGVEHLWARAEGITLPASGSSTWLSAVSGLDLDVNLFGPLALAIHGGLVLSLQRPEFTVTGLGLVHRPATAGAEANVGLVWSW